MKNEPKILEDNESTFRNGGGGVCGGVISQSRFDAEPWGNMMAYVMDDDKFEIYKKLKSSKGTSDQKEAKRWFKKYARSMI